MSQLSNLKSELQQTNLAIETISSKRQLLNIQLNILTDAIDTADTEYETLKERNRAVAYNIELVNKNECRKMYSFTFELLPQCHHDMEQDQKFLEHKMRMLFEDFKEDDVEFKIHGRYWHDKYGALVDNYVKPIAFEIVSEK